MSLCILVGVDGFSGEGYGVVYAGPLMITVEISSTALESV